MRLDKFLKVSRLVKQRPRAKILCDAGAVKINGKVCRAGKTVNQGDILDVIIGNRSVNAEILRVPVGNVSKNEANTLIEIREEKFLDEQW
ncbi:RNA-binding S4 domain-containing protein [bacterium]|nr:RNA-binding S4 domain-containing protein [bacterium]